MAPVQWLQMHCQWYQFITQDRHRSFKLGGGVDHFTCRAWTVDTDQGQTQGSRSHNVLAANIGSLCLSLSAKSNTILRRPKVRCKT